MDRDVAHHAFKGRADCVVGQLLFLRLAQFHRRLVIRLSVAEGLLRLLVNVTAGHAGLEELTLPLDLRCVVVVECLLLPLGGARRLDGGHLVLRIDLHQRLAGLHMVAGANLNPGQPAVHLRLHRGRAPRLDGGHILARLRHRLKRYRHRLHRHGLHPGSGRGHRLLLAARDRQPKKHKTTYP